MHGTLDVWAKSKSGDACTHARDYQNLPPTADVILKDESGKILGKGSLLPRDNGLNAYCGYSFEIDNVPVAKFYSLTIGPKDGPVKSYEEMVKDNWMYALELGAYK